MSRRIGTQACLKGIARRKRAAGKQHLLMTQEVIMDFEMAVVYVGTVVVLGIGALAVWISNKSFKG